MQAGLEDPTERRTPGVAKAEPVYNGEGGALYGKYHTYSIAVSIAVPADYDLCWAKLTSITGVSRFRSLDQNDFDFSATILTFLAAELAYETVSEQVRLLTTFDFPANFMLGGYYQNEKTSTAVALPVPQDPATGRFSSFISKGQNKGTTWSGFGQLTAGDPLEGDFSDSNISPEATLMWRNPRWWLDSDLTLYGAYKQGFKSGGLSSIFLKPDSTADDARFKSERVSGFEGGLKSTWFDNVLRLNVVGYRYPFKDLRRLWERGGREPVREGCGPTLRLPRQSEARKTKPSAPPRTVCPALTIL